MNFLETPLGFETELGGFLFFFAKRDANLETLATAYPSLQWARIRQTHSDLVVESAAPAPVATQEADAHFTSSKNLGLLISTADCVPILVADPRRKITAAIHAGWRGVENRITVKTVRKLVGQGSRAEDLVFAVGPHISFDSFEVDLQVRDQLLACVKARDSFFHRDLGGGKALVNLRALVHAQIGEFGVPKNRIFDLPGDTKSDPRFHSHRRDREKSGRQLSFSVILK